MTEVNFTCLRRIEALIRAGSSATNELLDAIQEEMGA